MKNIKVEYNNNEFKISAPTWNDGFNLPDESYSISGIQDYFECIIKKHKTEQITQLSKFTSKNLKMGLFYKCTKIRICRGCFSVL